MRQALETAGVVLAEEVRRRAAGPDHIAYDAVTWRDLDRVLRALETQAILVDSPRDAARDVLPLALSAYTTPGWLP